MRCWTPKQWQLTHLLSLDVGAKATVVLPWRGPQPPDYAVGFVDGPKFCEPEDTWVAVSENDSSTTTWLRKEGVWRSPLGPPEMIVACRETWRPSLTEYHHTGKGHGGPDDPCVAYRSTMKYRCGKPVLNSTAKWRGPQAMAATDAQLYVKVLSVEPVLGENINQGTIMATGIALQDTPGLQAIKETPQGFEPRKYWSWIQQWQFDHGQPWEPEKWMWLIEIEKVKGE